jgi:oxygen-independent coproporphyrinogen-3 oxidase
MNIEALITKYDQRVPRYTSYPTAPHFRPMADDTTYRAWLADLDTPLSLYLHVPFCASLCLFCGCNMSVARHDAPMLAYAANLIAEIDLVADAIGRRLPVRHVHWGGGTPTALPAAAMVAIANKLRARFDFASDAEIAVEVDPRTLSASALGAIAAMGTTRASLGVQDFDPKVQACIGRIQSYDTTADCADRLRGVGVTSLNLDLIYGLPHQTQDGVAATIGQALKIAPDRIAMFGYAHVPWMKKHQALIPDSALPGPAERFAERAIADRVIGDAGYQAIGIDHFALADDSLAVSARDGRIRRNFQGYTTDDAAAQIGLGASSIGALPQGYVQNHSGVPAWRDAVRAGRLPVARGVALTEQDRLRRDVIEQVMCQFTVDLAATEAAHGFPPGTLRTDALDGMDKDGLVVRSGWTIRVTEAGRPFVRAVAACFDTYLQAGEQRHSSAV